MHRSVQPEKCQAPPPPFLYSSSTFEIRIQPNPDLDDALMPSNTSLRQSYTAKTLDFQVFCKGVVFEDIGMGKYPPRPTKADAGGATKR